MFKKEQTEFETNGTVLVQPLERLRQPPVYSLKQRHVPPPPNVRGHRRRRRPPPTPMPKPHHAASSPPPPLPPPLPLLPLALLPPRHCPLAAALLTLLSVLLATALWLVLVLAPASQGGPPAAGRSAVSDAAGAALADPDAGSPLELRHIVFGIAGSAHLWPRRREYVRLWWDPAAMRGHVWLDAVALAAPGPSGPGEDSLPPIRVSEDTSRFLYTNPTGHPSGLRIARIAAEAVRLVGGGGARWVVLVDDDTVLSADNLVAVLGKYDWREMVYVGAPSESHSANTYFSHSMAFGGGGVALSLPLAAALAETLDVCIERYPRLYGSDDRLHACITELGVPLTREYGFHQVSSLFFIVLRNIKLVIAVLNQLVSHMLDLSNFGV